MKDMEKEALTVTLAQISKNGMIFYIKSH